MKLKIIFTVSLMMLLISCSDNVSPKPEYGKIQIRVADAVNHSAITDAVVSTTPPSHTVFLNFEGQYLMEDVLPGEYMIKVEKIGYLTNHIYVRVNAGKTATAEMYLYDESFNNSQPGKPTLLAPAQNSVISNRDITLKWDSDDLDKDELTYTVYFDNVNPPQKILFTNYSSKEAIIPILEDNTRYFWYVIAKDKYSISNSSQVYSFKVDSTLIFKVPNRSLHLSFDDTFADSGPNNIVVKCNVPKYTQGYSSISKAYDFNKNPVIVSYHNDLNLINNFTITFWIKPSSQYGTDMIDGYCHIIGTYNATGEGNGNYFVGLNSNGKLVLRTYHYQKGDSDALFSHTVSTQEWTFVALTFKDGDASLYINGNLAETKKVNLPQSNTKSETYIGARMYNNRYFLGAIDELSIFKSVLKIEQIQSLMY